MAEIVHRVTSPLAGRRDALPLRQLTGYEEEYVELHREEPNTARLCNELLARCLVEPGAAPSVTARARVEGLLVAERDRELLRLRQMSLGAQVRSEVDCPHCGQISEVSFDLASLPVEFERPPDRIDVRVSDNVLAALRPMTAGDQAALLDAGAGTRAERRSVLLALLLVEWGGRAGPFDVRFARALSVADRALLDEGLARAVTGLDLSMSVTCASCGQAFSSPFGVGGFFLPS